MSKLPKCPWLDLSMDFCRPLPTGEYLIVIIDEYSRYPVVEITRSTSAQTVIPIMDKVFSIFSYPKQIKTDNGPPFNEQKWADYCEHNGIVHRKITPLWPQSNYQAESFNKPLHKAIRSSRSTSKNWKEDLHSFLRMYRCTEHVTTGFSPHRLLFGREPKTKLPEVVVEKCELFEKVNQNDTKKKQIMKSNKDKKRHTVVSVLYVGDKVYMK